jgi:hypothetical protein
MALIYDDGHRHFTIRRLQCDNPCAKRHCTAAVNTGTSISGKLFNIGNIFLTVCITLVKNLLSPLPSRGFA